MLAPDTAPLPKSRRLSAHWRFLLAAAGLYVLWLVGYEGFVAPDGRLDAWLSLNIAQPSAALLRALGFAATVPTGLAVVYMDGQPAVVVGTPCNGLTLYALFAGFVLAFPGAGWSKLWFIPAGILVIFLLNVVRVAALALNQHYAHRSVDFNHHYTFTFVVYACIGALWIWWARRQAPATVAEAAV